LLLAHVGDRRQLGDRLDLGQLLRLPAVVQVVLELEGRVEVILDRPLVAPGDEDDLLEPGGHRLLHHVLDGGLVHERQHLLRLRLGRGQEAGTETGGGKHGFPDLHRIRRYTRGTGKGTQPAGGPSSGVRTWMPSFLIRYQRLRSEMPSTLAARACTPWVCESASRIMRRSQSSSASSSEPVSTGALSAAAGRAWIARWIAAGRWSGLITPSLITIAPSSTCCSSRTLPGHA